MNRVINNPEEVVEDAVAGLLAAHPDLLAVTDNPRVIRAVHAGKKRIPPEIAIELAEHTSDDDLSPREIEVLRLIAAGNANKQIASKGSR